MPACAVPSLYTPQKPYAPGATGLNCVGYLVVLQPSSKTPSTPSVGSPQREIGFFDHCELGGCVPVVVPAARKRYVSVRQQRRT